MTNDDINLSNQSMNSYSFLTSMFRDSFYPDALVEKGKLILLKLCAKIEQLKPADLAALYVLTNLATDEFNELQQEFYDQNSEIETGARDCIAMDFDYIAKAYGFLDADLEELVANRDW
jgi:Family of unknown function (DUF5713)